nr:2-oxoglutarate oxidoreductase [Calditrichia bacterium]
MFNVSLENLVDIDLEQYSLQDYQGSTPRWCSGCGDNAILSAVQKLCRDEQLPPEKTVFVSGIG